MSFSIFKITRCAFLMLLLTCTPLHADITATFVHAGPDELSNPHDLKLSPDGRHLYVSDLGNDRIAILDPDSLKVIGAFGSDHLSGPHDIDIDTTGHAYVADTHNSRVTLYALNEMDAKLIGELSVRIRGPEGVLKHPNGLLYVAGAWSNNLVAYERGSVVMELRGLSAPHDIELADDGENIWLADAGNDRILLLSPNLEIQRELARDSYRFNGVRYLDLLADGTLIAADKNNHQIKFVTPNGNMPLVLGDGNRGRGPGKFATPEGVETRGADLWLSDSGNNRVVRYRLSRSH
ncbi:MAG: NHL repeat-containing protein [Candidatus Thiodiazotropha sp.]